MSPGSGVKSEYMKRYREPRWDEYAQCYRELLRYRLGRRLLEQAPWLGDAWGPDSPSDSSAAREEEQRAGQRRPEAGDAEAAEERDAELPGAPRGGSFGPCSAFSPLGAGASCFGLVWLVLTEWATLGRCWPRLHPPTPDFPNLVALGGPPPPMQSECPRVRGPCLLAMASSVSPRAPVCLFLCVPFSQRSFSSRR